MRKPLAIAAMTAFLAIAAPSLAAAQVYVRVGPPAPVYERRGPLPAPGYVWHPGFQRWNGNRYEWVPGSYMVPPRAHARWVPGRWTRSRRGYFWREGYWR